ncbi:hypothetical protein [Nocardia crassostreae]|nr:hypothetical protein [Nocardia crassostreae]
MNERYLNVVDVEATCWEKANPPGMPNEIIEIGCACSIPTAWNG